MDLKQRLQRVLQILEDAEREGGLCDLERDIVLGELREAYAELKFSDKRDVCSAEMAMKPLNVEPEIADDTEEPEVEVELLFEEDVEEEQSVAEKAIEPTTEPKEEPKAETKEEPKTEPKEEPKTETKEEPKEAPKAEPSEELSSLVSHLPSKKSSPLLSLYDDEHAPVIGEQFHDKASVADTIACPRGVAESAPVLSLREAIGVADKFMLIRELFGGDAEAYDAAIDALDRQPSFDDCVIYISENFAWRAQSEATKFVMSLLQRKFNE